MSHETKERIAVWSAALGWIGYLCLLYWGVALAIDKGF
jgi:hypothetical protein